ncbi:MAG: pyridoxine 5'-phosphate synthase [Crocinitomicaceae bacterium]
MAKLSVNINKIATIRNARGGNVPNLVQVAIDCQEFGAEGITVHPRPDERHITTQDVYELKRVVTTEFNIEGYPDERFMNLVREVQPEQATLVPDPPGVLTSNAGWDTIRNFDFLKTRIDQLKAWGIRTSIFIENDNQMLEFAAKIGVDRVEFYTGPYAEDYTSNRERAIAPYLQSARICQELGLGINAGHDLSLENLKFFNSQINGLLEVSIGHALISDALYFGLENTINMYKNLLR